MLCWTRRRGPRDVQFAAAVLAKLKWPLARHGLCRLMQLSVVRLLRLADGESADRRPRWNRRCSNDRWPAGASSGRSGRT
eukprot:2976613-Alexandrium_andersonii.AAC.1